MPTIEDIYRHAKLDPALLRLRYLPPDDLDSLVERYVTRCDLQELRTRERRAGQTTYRAQLTCELFALSIPIRVYQRTSRLQAHQVDAFAGYLQRTGAPVGVLISTGDVTREAVRACRQTTAVRIVLLPGPEWLADLDHHRLVKSRLRAWCDDAFRRVRSCDLSRKDRRGVR